MGNGEIDELPGCMMPDGANGACAAFIALHDKFADMRTQRNIALMELGDLKMRWSKEPPTVPGWWWVRQRGSEPYLVKIKPHKLAGWRGFDTFEFAGPLAEPENA